MVALTPSLCPWRGTASLSNRLGVLSDHLPGSHKEVMDQKQVAVAAWLAVIRQERRSP